MSVASSRGSPWRICGRAFGEPLDERVVDRVLHQQPRARPGRPVRRCRTGPTACSTAASRSASANTTIGDLPPSSSDTGVRFGPRPRATSRAGRDDPVNAMRSTSGWPTSAAPASSPIPCRTLNDAVGQPGVVGDVGEQRRGQRRPLGRLQHDGVPRGQRRRDAPGRQHQRRVPRRDDGGHACRSHDTWLVCPRVSKSSWCELERARRRRSGSCARRAASRCADANGAASRCRVVSTSARSATRFSTPSATACRIRARSAGGRRGPRGEGVARGGRRPRRRSGAAAARDLGDHASRRSARRRRTSRRRDATRSPPIQCRWRPRRPRRSSCPWATTSLQSAGAASNRSVPKDIRRMAGPGQTGGGTQLSD